MSRIGKKPILLPSGVTVTIKDNTVTVKGPKGQLSQSFRPEVAVEQNQNQLLVIRKSEERQAGAYHGLYRSLFANMILGVTKGFSKTLELQGVGFRASIEKVEGEDCLIFKKGELGFSHNITFPIPSGITAEVQERTRIVLRSIDKSNLGQTAAKIRNLRAPDVYKGKGIRYLNENVRIKVGKSGSK